MLFFFAKGLQIISLIIGLRCQAHLRSSQDSPLFWEEDIVHFQSSLILRILQKLLTGIPLFYPKVLSVSKKCTSSWMSWNVYAFWTASPYRFLHIPSVSDSLSAGENVEIKADKQCCFLPFLFQHCKCLGLPGSLNQGHLSGPSVTHHLSPEPHTFVLFITSPWVLALDSLTCFQPDSVTYLYFSLLLAFWDLIVLILWLFSLLLTLWSPKGKCFSSANGFFP